MLRTAVLLASLFAVVSATTVVDIKYDGQTYNVCDGDVARVTWEGYHNIQEVTLAGYDVYNPAQNIGDPVHGFEDFGAVLNITGLAAPVDQMRYFVCTAHPDAKFITTCESVIDPTTTTVAPTDPPTEAPTTTTTVAPTDPPTTTTTIAPTDPPTEAPTTTVAPTDPPTTTTTIAPTDPPTEAPTTTVAPTDPPTVAPTDAPTEAPTTAKPKTNAVPTLTIVWAFLGTFLFGLLVLWCYMTCKDYSKEERGEDEQVLLEMA